MKVSLRSSPSIGINRARRKFLGTKNKVKKWNYYNDNDPFCCAWARNLIKAGLVPDGEVDCRPIQDIKADEIKNFTQCHFFCGILGWSLALRLAGWPDSKPVWTGSCPCQPYSVAGKGEGDADERNLWPEMFRLIRECRPECVFGEQVEAAIGHGWLDGVSTDLEGKDYAVGAAVLGAHSVGAPHRRQRLWWVADAGFERRQQVSRSASGNENENGRQPHGDHIIAGYGANHRLADAGETERERGTVEGRRSGVSFHATERSCVGGLDNPASSRCQRSIDESESEARDDARMRLSDEAGGTRGMGHSARHDKQRSSIAAMHGQGVEAGGSSGARIAESSRWSDFALVPCADEKARRVEPGTFPLAHAWPDRSMGPLRAVLERMGVDPKDAQRIQRNARGTLAKASRNRTGRLCGYGNAIVPEVAAEFIKAFLETKGEIPCTYFGSKETY